MAVTQQTRQNQLFYGEDWRVIYTAFTQVNFAAYDFDTIRAAMIDYIRLNYPEDFNDWIESSEFVAIIDLLAYLGQSLAFRMDLNTRENFLDTATRRESVIRLARMLSYNAPRAMPSQGLLKITTVISSQDLYDGSGQNIKNVPVTWNDQNNSNWLEQFVLIVNNSLNSNNYFGNPVKSGNVNGIDTELYEMNTTASGTSVFPFTTTVAGNTMNFELINPDFTTADTTAINASTSGVFFERSPDPANSWFLIYRSDGLGNSSANTGFFLMMKQGNLGYSDFQLDYPIANRVIDIDVNDINNIDVWVQNIDNAGNVLKNWQSVPSVNGYNVIYNSLSRNQRDIYSVYTRDADGLDQISLRFADGNFGNVPTGILRVWYRVSNGLVYQIRPTDMQSLSFAYNYSDNLNNTFSIVFTASLQNTVANSQARATNQQIKLAASQTYYTQDRMVTGEDYNLYPLVNTQALKVKAVNRVYSGQSRYLDINDPTGTYQNTKIVSTDGILYLESEQNRVEVSVTSNQNSTALVTNYIQPMINGSQGQTRNAQELQDFYYYNYPRSNIQASGNIVWQTATVSTQNCTGAFYINVGNVDVAQPVGSNVNINSAMHNVTTGSLLNINDNWVQVTTVNNQGIGTGNGIVSNGQGAVTITPALPRAPKYVPHSVIASWNPVMTSAEQANVATALDRKNNFGIRYEYRSSAWIVVSYSNVNTGAWSLANAGDVTNTNKDSSWLILCVYKGATWQFYSRATRYLYESVRDVRFLPNTDYKTIDIVSGTAKKDILTVLDINTAPQDPQIATPAPSLGHNFVWDILGQDMYPDGYTDPTKVYVTPAMTALGAPAEPNQYTEIVDPQNIAQRMVFWTSITSSYGYQYWQPRQISPDRIYTYSNQLPPSTDPGWATAEVAYVITSQKFYAFSRVGTQGILTDVTSMWRMRIGRNGLRWIYEHFAPNDQRIDPAVMNIIDTYVLTSTYDTDIRNWIATNGAPATQPAAPTAQQLREIFQTLEGYKTMTDQIIWHPVKYKIIFGSQAPSELQVRFKVVKAAGTTVTDNEVKSRVIAAVTAYFSLVNWDFGQSFFFTELAAYIHIELATVVATVVITPVNAQAQFGDLFEIKCAADEIFISCARVSDVDIVTDLTEMTLGITNG
jgi:hypothetical protein